MLDYEKKYLQLTQFFGVDDISDEFPNANGFEKCVIVLRRNKGNYGDIQQRLGMPSKKQIRAVLLKGAPELIDNSKTKVIKVSVPESELYNIIKNHNNELFEIGNDSWKFFIDNNKLLYTDKTGTWEFSDGDENTQSQILDEVKEQINNGCDKML